MLQCASCLVSSVSVFLCMIACGYTAIQLGFLLYYTHCQLDVTTCYCTRSQSNRGLVYDDTDSCQTLQLYAKSLLSTQSALNFIGSIASFWLVVTIWQSRYASFEDTAVESAAPPP